MLAVYDIVVSNDPPYPDNASTVADTPVADTVPDATFTCKLVDDTQLVTSDVDTPTRAL